MTLRTGLGRVGGVGWMVAAGRRELSGLHFDVGEAVQRLVERHPRVPLPLLARLRRWKPILLLGNTAMVTKYDDVREVLFNGGQFGVDFYRLTMESLSGPRTLGMAETPEYATDTAALRGAVRREDLPRIARLVDETASEAVAASNGSVDFVRGLANAVPIRLVADYFGTPGLDAETQVHWTQSLFGELFLNLAGDARIAGPAMATAAAWNVYVDGQIAARKAQIAAGQTTPDDVLCRLLRQQGSGKPSLTDVKIRANLIYMMVGFIPQVGKAAVMVLQELLRRPEALAGAQRAARDDDDQLLSAYVFEALRFNPHQPGLVRICTAGASGYVLAEGTRRATCIPDGTVAFLAIPSAMFDEEALDRPEEFRLDRPWEQYLFFGAGQHECLGEHVSRRQLPLILKPLLRQRNLRPAAGDAGEISWNGAFLDSWTLEFDQPASKALTVRRALAAHTGAGVRVNTVAGTVRSTDLGRTLMHEHVFVLSEGVTQAFPGVFDREAHVREAVQRLNALYDAGFRTVVELSVLGPGRDIHLLRRVAEQTRVNLIAATGIYAPYAFMMPSYFTFDDKNLPVQARLLLRDNPDAIAELFVRDIEEGIAGTRIRAGLLKCATDVLPAAPGVPESGVIPPQEKLVLQAVARAHRKTGVPITTHSNAQLCQGLLQQDVFEAEGVDLSRVIIGHSGDSKDLDYLTRLVERGSYIGMDRFGLTVSAVEAMPTVEERCDTVAGLCRRGYAEKMVLSHDAAVYMDWVPEPIIQQTNPNWHYLYIAQQVLPMLSERGVTDEQIRKMLAGNPKNIFERQGGY